MKFFILFVFYSSLVFADIPECVKKHEDVTRVTTKNYIFTQQTGEVQLPWSEMKTVLESDDALMLIQKAYAELLKKGRRPEFEIKNGRSRNEYFYVNKKNQRSDVKELCRIVDEQKLDAVYFFSSTRGFGYFETVIHVHCLPLKDRKVKYELNVYAYPENSASRFFARHLKLVDRFFEKKSEFMVDVTYKVFKHICTE